MVLKLLLGWRKNEGKPRKRCVFHEIEESPFPLSNDVCVMLKFIPLILCEVI